MSTAMMDVSTRLSPLWEAHALAADDEASKTMQILEVMGELTPGEREIVLQVAGTLLTARKLSAG